MTYAKKKKKKMITMMENIALDYFHYTVEFSGAPDSTYNVRYKNTK